MDYADDPYVWDISPMKKKSKDLFHERIPTHLNRPALHFGSSISPDTKIALQPLIKSNCRAMAYGL